MSVKPQIGLSPHKTLPLITLQPGYQKPCGWTPEWPVGGDFGDRGSPGHLEVGWDFTGNLFSTDTSTLGSESVAAGCFVSERTRIPP